MSSTAGADAERTVGRNLQAGHDLDAELDLESEVDDGGALDDDALDDDAVVVIVASTTLPTAHGTFRMQVFRVGADAVEHVAMTRGDLTRGQPLVRVHSECLTGDVLGSLRCDCGEQLARALHLVGQEEAGAVVYLRGQEGRGIGLGEKVKAYALQEAGLDTIAANVALGHPVDARDYGPAAAMLRALGAGSVRLLTNNPDKADALEAAGIRCGATVPMVSTVTEHNERYLRTKASELGHLGLVVGPRA